MHQHRNIMYTVTTYSGIQQGWRTMGTRQTPELALQLFTALTRIKPTFKHRVECDVIDLPFEWVIDDVKCSTDSATVALINRAQLELI
jgi:hypothetical protein